MGVGPASKGTKKPRERTWASAVMSGVMFTGPAGTPAACSVSAAASFGWRRVHAAIASSMWSWAANRCRKSASSGKPSITPHNARHSSSSRQERAIHASSPAHG